MAIDILKGSSGTPLVFLLVQSSDHITGLTGASPTVKLGKNGGTGAAPSGAVTEIDSTNLPGWYKVAGNATDTNTAGPLVLHATAASADPCDVMVANIIDPTAAVYGANLVNIAGSAVSATTAQLGVNVVNYNNAAVSTAASGIPKVDVDTIKTNPVVNGGTITFPTGATLASTTNITGGTITTTTNLTNLPSIPNNWITAAGINSGALNGKGDWLLSSSYTTPPTVAAIATGVWTDTTAGDFTVAASIGKSVMNGVALGTGLTINGYTGNTPQTGDAYARIGAAGVGLTNLGDTRIANLDAAVSSRMATFALPTGFLAATFPSAVGDATVANQSTINTNVLSRLAAASYTAPDNADISAIKAKTDSLTFDVAGYASVNIRYVNSVAINGAGTSGSPFGP